MSAPADPHPSRTRDLGPRTAALVRELSIPLLRDLTEAEVSRLLGAGRVREYGPGETIVAQSDRTSEMYIVVSGLVRVTAGEGVSARTVAELGAGACFGEMRLLTGRGASATVGSLTPSTVLVVKGEAFHEAMAQGGAFSRNIGMILAERLRAANRRSVAQSESMFVPVLATAPQDAVAQLLALNLAVGMARHSTRRVLLVNLTFGGRPSALPRSLGTLPSLSDLRRSSAMLDEHDQPVDARGALFGLRIVEERLDGTAPLPALDGVAKALGDRYDYVVAVMPEEIWGAFEASLSRARRIVALVGDGDDRATLLEADRIRTRAGEHAAVRAVVTSRGAEATQQDLAALSESYGGLSVSVVPSFGRAAAADPLLAVDRRDTPQARAVAALARDVLGMKVGIALGAGGVKGYAHIGVLETLQREGVPVDCISGCSIGSVVGSLWALRHEPDDIERLLDETRKYAIRPTLPFRSLLSSHGIARHIKQTAAGRRFEDTEIPLAIVAVDLLASREVVFRSGPLWQAILASSSIPGIYPPVKIGDVQLVDGGVINPVPITTAASLGADLIVGVKLTNPAIDTPRRKDPNIVDTLLRSTELMQSRIADETAARATVLIEPQFSASAATGLRGFSQGRDGRELGRAAAEAALPRLRSILPWLN